MFTSKRGIQLMFCRNGFSSKCYYVRLVCKIKYLECNESQFHFLLEFFFLIQKFLSVSPLKDTYKVRF